MKKIIFLMGILCLFFCVVRSQEVTRGQLMQLFYSAQKYQKDGNNEGAIRSYNEIVRLAPALPEAYLALGFLYSANDDDKSMELALHSYRKYIELAPHDVQRDSIARIVSALEQFVKMPENNMNVDPDIELIVENVVDNNELIDNIPESYNPPINPTTQIEREKEYSKTFTGKWISDRFVQSTMIPQWVFDISDSDNTCKISFHSASQRYSKYLDSKEREAVYVNDSCLFVRFARPELFIPSISEYYVKGVMSQISNPLFVYSITGQEKNMKSDELARRKKSQKELMDKLSDAHKDWPEQRETIEELTIIRLSDYAFKAKCKEILKIQRYGENPVIDEDVFETVFYKIPDNNDMTFIMLGKDNCLITNCPETDEQPSKKLKSLIRNYRKQEKKQFPRSMRDMNLYNHLSGIDSLGYYQWQSKIETKNLLKTIGSGLVNVASVAVSALAVSQMPVVDTFGGMILQWLGESVYSKSVNSMSTFSDTIDEKVKINPLEWNKKMYQSLLDYYGNNEIIIYK